MSFRHGVGAFPSAECLGDVCDYSDEGLYLRSSVLDSGDEPVFPTTSAIWRGSMDDIHPYFAPPRYPTDNESDSDARLTLTASVESDPSEPSYSSYHVETDPSEPSFQFMIRLSSNSASSSSVAPRRTPPPVRGYGFIRTHVVPRGRGRARGGGRDGATPGGFGNGYLPPDE